MCIHDFDAVTDQCIRERKNADGTLAGNRQRRRRYAETRGLVENLGTVRRIHHDAMAARDEARRLGQHADLLSAPTVGRFSMRNRM